MMPTIKPEAGSESRVMEKAAARTAARREEIWPIYFPEEQPEPRHNKADDLYSPAQLSACHDVLIEAIYSRQDSELRAAVLEKHAPEPYPNKCVRPSMPFVPTEFRFSGTFSVDYKRKAINGTIVRGGGVIHTDTGKIIKRTGGLFVFADKITATAKEARSWFNFSAAEVRHDNVRNATKRILCACCLQSEIGEHEFLLCDVCTSLNERVGFSVASRADFPTFDSGAQEDVNATGDYEYISPDEPFVGQLYEHELSVILAKTCAGFTVVDSAAYRKARRAAAFLVGHFVFGHRFVDLALAVPTQKRVTTEKAVEQFCKRSREAYKTRYLFQPVPEEANAAIRLCILRSIYPQALNSGYLMRAAA